LTSEQLAVGAKPYQVQVHSGGSGRYTVIFESGFGTDLRAWRKVAPEVAKVARTLAYSRAGHGASEARRGPRTIAQNADELKQLIAAAKAAPPFILVGHSYGGLLMRAFAARHPQQVAGMVLVDPADERFNPALRALDAAIKRELHADFLRQFTHGSQVVTANSGHNIQLDEPELVIATITKVIGAADSQSAQAGR